jgi:hypothetical protein
MPHQKPDTQETSIILIGEFNPKIFQLATHWHDDHIRGIGTLVETCRSAQFCLSSALRAKEFLTLVAAYGKRTMMVSSGIKEFRAVIEALQSRLKKPKEKNMPPKYAIADRCLWATKPDELDSASWLKKW